MLPKYKTLLSDAKTERDRSLDFIPHKDLPNVKQNKNKKQEKGYMDARGGMVPDCSQIHNKSSDSEKMSEDELVRRRSSRWRTSHLLQVKDEKNILMEKFESSLKERLLSSAHFTKQVPLFDSITKEKTRLKTPIDDDDNLNNNESIYNSVFPARKETGKSFTSSTINIEVFSKHNKESNEWLKELEGNPQVNSMVDSDLNQVVKSKAGSSPVTVSSRAKSGHKRMSKSKSNKDKDIPEGTTDLKNSEKSKPKTHKRRTHSPKSTLKKSLAKGDKNENEITVTESYDNLIQDSKKHSRKASKDQTTKDSMSELTQNQDEESLKSVNTTRDEVVESKMILDKDNYKINSDSSGVLNQKRKLSGASKVRALSRSKTLNSQSSSIVNNNSVERMDVIYIEKDVSEKESFEIYGQDGVGGKIRGTKRQLNLDSSASSNLVNSASVSLTTNIQRGGAQAQMDEMGQWDTYNVAYVETDNVSEMVDNSEPDNKDQITAVTTESGEVNDTVNEDDPEDTVKEHIMEDEVEGEDECVDEPCNEPSWFEEYGIDKKRRHEMGDTKLDKGSSSSSEQDEDILEDKPAIVEIIPDVVEEEKKKVKKKTRPTDGGFQIPLDIKELVEEPKGPELKTIREIKTIPLVCIEKPEKEEIKEKPKYMPMEYLKKQVGKYLAAGVAQVALYMPSDPVEYLAHWLIKERRKDTLINEMKKFKAEVKQIRETNISEMKKKQQMDYLKEETFKLYDERKEEPLYPVFDSETDLYHKTGGYIGHKMGGEEEEPMDMEHIADQE